MKLRSRVAAGVAAVMIFAGLAGPAAAAQGVSFSDVGLLTWAEPSIQGVALLGIMSGTGSGQFDPIGTTTRAQLAVTLARLLDWPSTPPQGPGVVQGTSFPDWDDVPAWAESAMADGVAAGIFRGEGNGMLLPDNPVTWDEMAVIVARALAYPSVAQSQIAGYLTELPEGAGAPSWAAESLAQDVQAGDFSGIAGALYTPGQAVTRAALAVLLMNLARGAGNPDFVSGPVSSVSSGQLTLVVEGKPRVLPLASSALVYVADAATTAAALQTGDVVSAVLVGGQAAWIDVTATAATESVTGSVDSVGSGQLNLTLPGGVRIALPLSATAGVTSSGTAAAISDVTPGTTATVGLNAQGTVTSIALVPAAAGTPSSGGAPPAGPTGTATGSGTASTSSGTTGAGTTTASGSGAGSTAAASSTSTGTSTGSTGGTSSTATASSGGTGTGSTAAATTTGTTGTAPAGAAVASLAFSPSPIAANGALAAGGQVTLTLTGSTSAGQPVPGGVVQLQFNAAPGGGSASVNGQALGATPQPYVLNGSGQLQLTYTAPSAPSSSGSDSIVATATDGSITIAATDMYTFGAGSAASIAQGAVSNYQFTPTPVATTGSLTAGQTVNVTLAADDSAGTGVGAAVVYLSLDQQPGGGSAWVNGTALTSTPQAFLTSSAGRIAITYTVPTTLAGAGAVDTIVAANAATDPTVTASDTYSYGQPVTGVVAPYATLTGTVQSSGTTSLGLTLPNGTTVTLAMAPSYSVTQNGQVASSTAVVVGDTVTVTLNGQEAITTIAVNSGSLGQSGAAGYITAVDTSAGTIGVYGSGGVVTYWLAQGAQLTLNGTAVSGLSQLPLGDNVTLTLNSSNFATAVSASTATGVTTGTVVSVVGGVITLQIAGTTQTVGYNPYSIAIRGGQLVPVTNLPQGTQVTIVPNAATYGGSLIVATS